VKWHACDDGAWRYQVFLDGEPLERVWSASEERGEVVVILPDEQGYVDVTAPRRVTRRGRVEIRKRETG